MIETFVKNARPSPVAGVYEVPSTTRNELATAFEQAGGTRINERKSALLSATRFQSIQYERHLDRIFAGYGPFSTGLDVGCGDGRTMEWLRTRGVKDRVGVEVSRDALARYAATEGGKASGTYLVCGSPLDVEFERGVFDFVTAIESLYYLGDKQSAAINHIALAMKPGALFLTSEIDFEVGLYHSALQGGLDSVEKLVSTRRSLEHIDQLREVQRATLADKDQMMSKVGFKLVAHHGISALPLLLIHQFHQQPNKSDALTASLARALEQVVSSDTNFNAIYLSVYQLT